jgi:hypothetical protein
VRYEVLTAAAVRTGSTVFHCVTPCSLLHRYQDSEGSAATFFRVEERDAEDCFEVLSRGVKVLWSSEVRM